MTTQKRAKSVVRESSFWMYRLRWHVAKSLGTCRQVAYYALLDRTPRGRDESDTTPL